MGVQQEVQNRTIRVSLHIGSFEIEVTGETEAELEQKLRKGISSELALNSLVPKLEENSNLSPLVTTFSDTSNPTLPASVGEILRRSLAHTETDRCLLVSNHLFTNGQREFTHHDILRVYRESGIPDPSNIHDVLNRLVKTADLRRAGEREGVRSFTMTQSGLARAESLSTRSGSIRGNDSGSLNRD